MADSKNPQSFSNGEIHDWYRIVLGFSDRLVAQTIASFELKPGKYVLDPFCGSGTTAVECNKRGIHCCAIDANPASCFAARVKTTWHLSPDRLLTSANEVCELASSLRRKRTALIADPTYQYLQNHGMLDRGWISKANLWDVLAIKAAVESLKHHKRTQFWLPHARTVYESLGGNRPFRYFTLCARPMVDVYMLVNEGILQLDTDTHRVRGVSFCECDPIIFPEMKELIGLEEAGFLAKLEDLVLFKDLPETQTLDSVDDITGFLESEGEGLAPNVRAKAEEKRSHLQFQDAFPFDFINLDFCDRYYGDPPDIMAIHATVDRFLEWQRRPGRLPSQKSFSVERFLVAITCRFDSRTPPEAVSRLKRLVTKNKTAHTRYENALRERSVTDVSTWANGSPLDFFMAAWPKEIARLAEQKSWNITVHSQAFYDRVNEAGQDYNMVCLIVEFSQTTTCNTYLDAVIRCLQLESRNEIPRFDPSTSAGRQLLSNLRTIVELRNSQARHFARELLPEPGQEIAHLRAAGVPI